MKSMKTRLFIVSGVLLAIGMTARTSGAQCAFQHPNSAKEVTMSLVQAFVQCNACVCVNTNGYDGASCTADADCQSSFSPDGSCFCNPSNAETLGHVPACTPPHTFNEVSEGPPNPPPLNGWLWGRNSKGSVSFRAVSTSLPNTADVAVKINLRGIEDAAGPVGGSGTLVATARFTSESRTTYGDMTVIDFPFGFPFTVEAGRASVKTSFNAWLSGAGQPPLPGCTSLQLLEVGLYDENGTLFASPGIFLPDLPN